MPPNDNTLDTPLSIETVEALRKTSTATLTNQLFKRELRNAFLKGPLPHNYRGNRMVGEAYTMRCIPSREDLDPLSVFNDYDHHQRTGVENVIPGQILVIDARGQASAASLGHILATRLQLRGAAGIVTDGAIRDSADFLNLDLPTFTAGVSPVTNLGKHHVVESQVPIGCGEDRKSTRLNSSHVSISYAVFCLKKKKQISSSVRAAARLAGLIISVVQHDETGAAYLVIQMD